MQPAKLCADWLLTAWWTCKFFLHKNSQKKQNIAKWSFFQQDDWKDSKNSIPSCSNSERQHVHRRGGAENADVMMPLFGKALFSAHEFMNYWYYWSLIHRCIALFASFDLYSGSLGLGSIEFRRRRRRRRRRQSWQPQHHRKVRKLQASKVFFEKTSSNSVWSVLSVREVGQVMEQKRAKQPQTWDVSRSCSSCRRVHFACARFACFSMLLMLLSMQLSVWNTRLQDVTVWWCWGSKVCWSVSIEFCRRCDTRCTHMFHFLNDLFNDQWPQWTMCC